MSKVQESVLEYIKNACTNQSEISFYLFKMSTRNLAPLQKCQNTGTFIAQQIQVREKRKESAMKPEENSQYQDKHAEIMLKFRPVNV